MIIERTIKFYLRHRGENSTDNLRVIMRVTIKGQKPVDFPLGGNIDASEWSNEAQRATGRSKMARSINRTIDEYLSACSDIFDRYEIIEKRPLTRDEFRSLFRDYTGQATPTTRMLERRERDRDDVSAVLLAFMSSEGSKQTWSDDTYEKFTALRNTLRDFDPNLRLSQIDEPKMVEYMRYLVARGMRNTTIQKNLSFVRWFLRWAAQHGYYNGTQHETFHPKLKGTSYESKTIVYLEVEELQRIENASFPPTKKYLERCRDVFVFCCYSGLRYSDVAKLRRSDVLNDHIYVVTQKTTETLRIELNAHTRAILAKYADDDFPGDAALPVVSNQKMNDYLKELGQYCRIIAPVRFVYYAGSKRHEKVVTKWEVMTTHCARRTFVVIGLQLGIPAEVIMRWTGHANYESMKPYVAIADDLKRQSMSKFDTIARNETTD